MKPRPLEPLVDEATTWGSTEWWRLELRSFDAAPSTLTALALLGPKAAWSKEHGRPSAFGCLQSFAFIVSLVTPAIAAIALVGWARDDAAYRPMPLDRVGWLFLISVIVNLYAEIRSLRSPRAVAMGAIRRVALVHIVPAALVLVVAAVTYLRGDVNPETPSALWLVPVVVDLAFHVVTLLRGSSRPGGPRNPIENLERSIAEIDAEERESIRVARNAAIDRVRERGMIDEETAARARATPLGKLALTLAPEARSAYYPASAEGTES